MLLCPPEIGQRPLPPRLPAQPPGAIDGQLLLPTEPGGDRSPKSIAPALTAGPWNRDRPRRRPGYVSRMPREQTDRLSDAPGATARKLAATFRDHAFSPRDPVRKPVATFRDHASAFGFLNLLVDPGAQAARRTRVAAFDFRVTGAGLFAGAKPFQRDAKAVQAFRCAG